MSPPWYDGPGHLESPDGLTVVVTSDTRHKVAQAPGAVDVFTDDEGAPVHPDRMSKRFTAAAKRAGIYRHRRSIHSVRHTSITSWLRSGVPVATVSKIAGHEDIGITLSVYAHAVREDDGLIAAATEAAVYGATAQ